MKSLIHGVGVNDLDYVVRISKELGITPEGKRLRETLWVCPYYSRWRTMLDRCLSEKVKKRSPVYKEASFCDDWVYATNFKSWMEQQNWEGKELDKDLLFPGNKIYSPDTCVFIDKNVNLFITEFKSSKGLWPTGVDFSKSKKKFRASCGDVLLGKSRHLGYFETPEEAHQAWLCFKIEQAHIIASEQTDSRVAKALIDRYENYQS